jgi:hypothetical protein
MFYISAVLSLAFWVVGALLAADKKWPIWTFVSLGIALNMCPFAIMPTFAIHFLALLVVVVIIRLTAVHPKRYAFPCTFAVTAVIYGYSSWRALHEYDALRASYPYESMEERIPESPRAERTRPLPAATDARMMNLERRHGTGNYFRGWMLRQIHEGTVDMFVSNPGFGIGRMLRPSEAALKARAEERKPIPQPVPRASPSGVPAGNPEPVPTTDEDQVNVHEYSLLDFSRLEGIGYYKDRRHVAGFRPHRFTYLSEAGKDRFVVETVDLVSLLRHPEPVAYVSADLPRMDELRHAPTRPLDAVESAALRQLREGEDLVSVEAGDRLRMIGSIRNLKQCVDCHGGERGDLLGAFSYTLRIKSADSGQ